MENLIELYNREIKNILSVGKVEDISNVEKEPLFVVYGTSPMLFGTKHILYDNIETDTYIDYYIDKRVVEEEVDFINYRCKILRVNKKSCLFNSEVELNLVKELIVLLNDILVETEESENYDNISIYTSGKIFTIITTRNLDDIMVNNVYKYFSKKIQRVQDKKEVFNGGNIYSFNVID